MSGGEPGAVMAAEMAEQPRALASLLAYRRERARAELGGLEEPRGVLLIARGSSDNAATYGRYLLEATLGVPVSLAAPSLWTRYGRKARLEGRLAIALSQSGRTPEIARVLELAAAAGAQTVAVTNEAGSPLARAADVAVELGVGPERAVPATKTVLGELLALAIVAEALGEVPWTGEDLESVPDAIAELLADDAAPAAAAAALAEARAALQVGGGYLYAVAQEGALKMVETSSTPVLAYSPSDLLHGPIALAGPEVPVVCYSAPGPLDEDARRVAEAAAARDARVVWVGESAPEPAALAVPVRASVPEPLAPLLHLVRAQQLALALARALGADPDKPAGLSKVTATS